MRYYSASILLWCSVVVVSFGFSPIIIQSRCRKNVDRLFAEQQSQSLMTTAEEDDEEGNTVVKLQNPSNGMLCTLVGTAHLSKASNDQVRDIITSVRPDVVMIELDKSRLSRIGFKDDTGEDLGIPFSTSEDIIPSLEEDDKVALANKPWWSPLLDFGIDSGVKIIRSLLTNMYDEMAEQMGSDDDDSLIPGGEFKIAIDTARDVSECERIILGDRDSSSTLRRAAELAVRGGNVLEVLNRLERVNSEQMQAATEEIKRELKEENGDDDPELTNGEFQVLVIEKLKSDKERRTKLFQRLEKEVPEFSRAFLQERDYIMAECINRESSKPTKHVVAVVGLAHVPGMVKNLKQSWNIPVE